MITTLPAIDSSGVDGSTAGYSSRETRFVNCMLVTKKSEGRESIDILAVRAGLDDWKIRRLFWWAESWLWRIIAEEDDISGSSSTGGEAACSVRFISLTRSLQENHQGWKSLAQHSGEK